MLVWATHCSPAWSSARRLSRDWIPLPFSRSAALVLAHKGLLRVQPQFDPYPSMGRAVRKRYANENRQVVVEKVFQVGHAVSDFRHPRRIT